jgi:hypothetical protein
MGGVEIGGIFDDSRITEAELELLNAARELSPDKFGHIVLASEAPQLEAQEENNA